MSIRLLHPGSDKCLFESPASGFPSKTDPVYQEWISPLPGDGEYREFRLRRIRIFYLQAGPGTGSPLRLEIGTGGVCMFFPLAGSLRLASGDIRQGHETAPGHHNIFFSKGQSGCCEWASGNDLGFFGVQMDPTLFCSLLPEDNRDLAPFIEAMRTRQNALMRPHALRITPLMSQLIQDMLETSRTGHFKRIFLESRVLELLLLQLEQMSTHDCNVFCTLRKTDVEKIHVARDIILSNPNTPCTLVGLAQQVGTNEFTLKKGFRELFGTTVFGLWSEMKMARARRLLTEEGLSVGEVSDLVGYKHAQHFSTAFKRRFGMPPGELRK